MKKTKSVLRFWGKDIKKNINECLETIDEAILRVKTEE